MADPAPTPKLTPRHLVGTFLCSLPVAVAGAIAAFEWLDYFRLRRFICAWLAYEQDFSWEGAVTLSGVAAFLAWTVPVAAAAAAGLGGLALLTADRVQRAAGRRQWFGLAGLSLFAGAIFMLPAMVLFSLAMGVFLVMWAVPGLWLLRAAVRELPRPPGLRALSLSVAWLPLLAACVAIASYLQDHAWTSYRTRWLSGEGQRIGYLPGGEIQVETSQARHWFDGRTGDPTAGGEAALLPDPSKAHLLRRWEAGVSGRQVSIQPVEGAPSLILAHGGEALAVAISPDGRLLASGGTDNAIRLWELPGLKLRRTLLGHSHDVTAITFSPDGRVLASTSKDETLMLWRGY